MRKELSRLIQFPIYIITFILLGLLFGYFTFKVLSFSRTVEVPNLYGKTLVESNRLLTSNGLYLKIEGEDYDATVPPGIIMKQDIPPGKKVKERRAIKVIISKGPRIKSIPLLVNETLLQAENLLLQKGLKIGKTIPVHSDIVEKDRIIAQKPRPEEQISDFITVIVSLGPYDRIYHCPDFKGMLFQNANNIIKKLHLALAVEGAGEFVLAQKPAPGKEIRTGELIYLKLY